MKSNIILIQSMMLFAIVLFIGTTCSMGDQQDASQKEPAYTSLDIGSENFDGFVRDEQTMTEVTQLSFSGQTSVGGLRRDDNDSVTTLYVDKIRSIKVMDQQYKSTRYPDKEFALIQKTALDGTVTNGLLLPRNVVICGKEKNTEDEKAWYLSKIDELTVVPTLDASIRENATMSTASANNSLTTSSTMQPFSAEEQPVASAARAVSLGDTPVAVSKEQFTNKEIKVVEKRSDIVNEKKTITQAINDLIVAIVGVFGAIFSAIISLFW